MEREAGEAGIGAVADRVGDAVERPDRAERMRRILDQHRAGRRGHGPQGRQVTDVAAQVDGQHGLDPLALDAAQRLAQGVGGHQAAVGIDIGEHHLGPDVAGAVGGGQEGDRRRDADIALTDAQGHHRQVQRGGPVGDGDRMLGPDLLGEGGLEGLDRRAGGQEVAAKGLRDGRDVVVLDRLLAVGEEAAHRAAFSSSMSSRPWGVSQSWLLSLLYENSSGTRLAPSASE